MQWGGLLLLLLGLLLLLLLLSLLLLGKLRHKLRSTVRKPWSVRFEHLGVASEVLRQLLKEAEHQGRRSRLRPRLPRKSRRGSDGFLH